MLYFIAGIIITLGTAAMLWINLPGPDGKMKPYLANGRDTWMAIAITMGFPLGLGGMFVGVLEFLRMA